MIKILTDTNGNVYKQGNNILAFNETRGGEWSKEAFVSDGKRLPYWLYVPNNLTANIPLIVGLHCSYGKATSDRTESENLDYMVTINDFPKFAYNGMFGDIGAVIIMPQTGTQNQWVRRSDEINGLVDYIKGKFNIDDNRVSLTGFSLGGTGTWEIASAYPNIYKRVLSVSGGLNGVTDNLIPYNPVTGEDITDFTKDGRTLTVAQGIGTENSVWSIWSTLDTNVQYEYNGQTRICPEQIYKRLKNTVQSSVHHYLHTQYSTGITHDQSAFAYLFNREDVVKFLTASDISDMYE